MKCNASPTTSIAADGERRRVATATVSAVLFGEILKPLAAGLGPLGERAVESVADRLFAPHAVP